MKLKEKKPSAVVAYHFFHPDDVAGARYFSDFAEELARRGWDVTALTSDRFCRYPGREIAQKSEIWHNVNIVRVKRPGWDQANTFLRMLNSFCVMTGWFFRFLNMPNLDVVIVGSDPQFSQLIFPPLRWFRHKTALVYWCYDLYPEAILADSSNRFMKWIVKMLGFITKKTYESIDMIVDIGPCMRKRLSVYKNGANRVTLTPWSLVEPEKGKRPNMYMRKALFGDASLALLYSGSMGKAHDFFIFLRLARETAKKDPAIKFCFACRGNRVAELKSAIRGDDKNICLAPFASEHDLEDMLVCADIHLISLRTGWDGVVVPSKFFGSLAAGKPVLYAGPEGSAVALWIEQFNLGLLLTEENIEKIAQSLSDMVLDRSRLNLWQENALAAYQKYFSKKVVMDSWDKNLKNLVRK